MGKLGRCTLGRETAIASVEWREDNWLYNKGGNNEPKLEIEIEGMFGRASGFIRAHSHPEEQHTPPMMNDLKADYERFKVIENDFK